MLRKNLGKGLIFLKTPESSSKLLLLVSEYAESLEESAQKFNIGLFSSSNSSL
jgi:hypothetical protein